MLKIDKRYLREWILMVLLTFPHLKPGYISMVLFWDRVFDIWRVLSFIGIFAGLIREKGRISKFAVSICLMEIYLFIVTLIQGGNIWQNIVNMASMISIVVLYDVIGKRKEVFYASQLACFEIVIYINLITEIIYPDTMYMDQSSLFVANRCWFLGYYNNHTKYFIPAILFALLYWRKTGKKLRMYLLMTAIAVSVMLVWSGGVLLSISAMLIVWLFFKNRTIIFNYYSYWLLHIVFFVGIIWLKFQNLFRWLIDDVLGKWGSLELRMNLWQRYLDLIRSKFIFGWGSQGSIFRELQVGFYWGMHCHNLFLEVVYQGGIFYLIWLAMIVFVAGKRVYSNKNTIESKIISIAFLGWCIATFVEPFFTPFLMGMFIVAYYSNEQEKELTL